MTSFFDSGFNRPTLTTADDPTLNIEVEDNGIHWTLRAYSGSILIDSIDLEKYYLTKGLEVHSSLLPKLVYIITDDRTTTLQRFLDEFNQKLIVIT